MRVRSTAVWIVLLVVVSAPLHAMAGDPPTVRRTWSSALFGEVAVGFIPYANDVPLMVGAGIRFAGIHEVWARGGYIPVGDDTGYGFGSIGYRAAFRAGRIVRPILGAFASGIPATCSHDALGRPTCTQRALFIFAATGGVRFEPVPWLGIAALLSLGVDTFPYPFGMIELALTFALPLS